MWQCLIDYKTTVLVGGLIGKTETTDNLLEAIKISKIKTGVTPMAIVIDNHLSENLPAIRTYLDDWGIEIIKTFPGNAKSNGIIEGNFNIFEKWVGGRVVLECKTAEDFSFSIAQMLTEVFTQLRNNQPRKSLSFNTDSHRAWFFEHQNNLIKSNSTAGFVLSDLLIFHRVPGESHLVSLYHYHTYNYNVGSHQEVLNTR